MKSTTALVKLFRENGFTLARSKKHPIWRCPCGHAQLVSVSTPCGGRGDINARLQIKRTLRECTTKEDATL